MLYAMVPDVHIGRAACSGMCVLWWFCAALDCGVQAIMMNATRMVHHGLDDKNVRMTLCLVVTDYQQYGCRRTKDHHRGM